MAAGTNTAVPRRAEGARKEARPRSADLSYAVVNGRAITPDDVLDAMYLRYRDQRRTLAASELEARLGAMYDETLDYLIERALIVDAFEQQRDWTLPEAVIDRCVEDVIRAEFGGERDALLRSLETDGITFAEWRRNLREKIVVSNLREREVEARVYVSPGVVRAAYDRDPERFRAPEQVALRMIEIRREETPAEAEFNLRRADALRRRALKGEPFDVLAREHSEGPKAAAGGDWGWLDPASRRPEIAEAVETLAPGGISDVVDTGEAYFIIKLEDRRYGQLLPFESVQERLRDELRRQEAQRLYDEWIRRLKQKAYIQRY